MNAQLSQVDVMEVLRLALERIEDIKAAFAPSRAEQESGGIPLDIAQEEMPVAIVLPGRTLRYILTQGRHRHTYQVRVLVLLAEVDMTEGAYLLGPMPDQILGELLGHVTADGYASVLLFKENQGLIGLEWAKREYMGYELIFEVSEAAAASPATGE